MGAYSLLLRKRPQHQISHKSKTRSLFDVASKPTLGPPTSVQIDRSHQDLSIHTLVEARRQVSGGDAALNSKMCKQWRGPQTPQDQATVAKVRYGWVGIINTYPSIPYNPYADRVLRRNKYFRNNWQNGENIDWPGVTTRPTLRAPTLIWICSPSQEGEIHIKVVGFARLCGESVTSPPKSLMYDGTQRAQTASVCATTRWNEL